MKSCPVFPIIGTVRAIGPNSLDKGDVLFRTDGPKQVDFEAMRTYVEPRGGLDAR
jgi:hypothetical protein